MNSASSGNEDREPTKKVVVEQCPAVPPFWFRIFSDPRFVLRYVIPSLLMLGLLSVILTAAILRTIAYLSPPVEIQVRSSGAIEIKLPNHERTAWVLLNPAGNPTSATPWINTGISIPAGSTAKIHVSGKITVALHHILEAASARIEYPPLSPWLGPEGLDPASPLPLRSRRREDDTRSDLLLYPNIFQGRLIGIISQSPPPVRPDSSAMINIGQSRTVQSSEHSGGELYLTINDIWLDRATLTSLQDRDSIRLDRWKSIDSTCYANAWYDDNGGSFLVVVEIR